MQHKKLIQNIGFKPKENTSGIFIKKYADDYVIELDFEKESIHYGGKIIAENKTTQNFSQAENWVVLECVNRLLEKGYKPENIILEKTWASGHGTSGRLDICVTHDDGSEYLLIECKTWGKEFEKELAKMKKDGGQLFTYFKFSNKADVLMLYASQLNHDVLYRNEIIKIEDDYRSGDRNDFYDKWNKLTKDNGVFDDWVTPYCFVSKALTPNLLKAIKQEDSSFIFSRFLEILRHNVVSDKGNAFNKIFTLFLCKIYDEKDKQGTDQELEFQWFEGKDDAISFQLRLTDLYKKGMYDFLEKRVTDFSETDFNNKYKDMKDSLRNELLDEFKRIRLEKNNEFAIKDVYDQQSFKENTKVVKEVVELLQGYKIRYTKKQQYLSDFFELLLTTGLKQESGQFFTPVPITQFIIKSLPIDKIVEAKLQAGRKDEYLPYVMDYAAGSGHFLTETMHEIQRLLDTSIDTSKLKADARSFVDIWRIRHFDWALQYVYGIEKDYRLVKVGKVGCYLHGDGLANVIHSDGLARFSHPDFKGKLLNTSDDFPQDNKQFDMVVSNPPYSVASFKGAAKEYYNESDFELHTSLTDSSSEIECLFIERTKQLLKDGGVAGIILPSSILNNSGVYTKSREMILQHFKIIAIAELGSNTFMATGTNTVTLFLRRRNNYDSINLKKSVARFFSNLQDVTLNGVESPVAKYVSHVWEGITFDDYKTLLQKSPNQAIKEHDIYQEYQKKIKAKKEAYKWQNILDIEAEKLLYFIIAYPQQLVLIKTGQKKEEKQFLGYEFSNRRGSEGIHPIQRDKSIDACTRLFDPYVFDNPEKASTYIYKAFAGDFDFPIDESLKNNVSRINLVDMMSFDRASFEKKISLTAKKKVNYENIWKTPILKTLGEITVIKKGTPITQAQVRKGNVPVIAGGKVPAYFHNMSNRESGIITVSASGANSGFVSYFSTPIFASDCNTIKSKDEHIFSTKLVYCFLETLQQEIYSLQRGQAQPHVYGDDLAQIKIPLPPIGIQKKMIADIEALEKTAKNSHERIAALHVDIVTILDAVRGNLIKLQDITAKIGSGATPRGGESSYKREGITLIRSQNIYDKGMLKKGLVFIDDSQAKKLSNVAVESNDVLFNITGASVARCCVVDSSYLPARVNQHVAIIRANEKVSPKYLQQTLVSKKIKYELLKIAQSSSTREAITKSQLGEFKIPLPSLFKQKNIVAEIESIEAKIAELEKKNSTIPAQKETILRKYLQ